MVDLSEKQKSTNWETLKHIELVMQLLAAMQNEILKRMFSHDRSKLDSPEMEMFEQFTDRLRGMTYGSEEYKQCLEEMKQSALLHHYENNRHHPEHFEGCWQKNTEAISRCDHLILALTEMQVQYPDDNYVFKHSLNLIEAYKKTLESNVNAMNLIDVVEMICDWLAAGKRHADGNIYRSIEINTERFGLSPQLVSILLNTVPLLNSVYSARTQKHLNKYWHCVGCGSGGMEGNFCSMCGAGRNDYVAPAETMK